MSSSKRRGQRAVGSGLSHLGGLQYLGEPLLAMGSSIGATATSGLMGLAFDGDRDLMEDVRQRMTYQPRSFSGQQGLQDLGQTVERVAGPALEYMQSNADAKFDETGSAAQATMHVIAPEAIFTMMG